MTDKAGEEKPTDALWVADALLIPIDEFPEPTRLEQMAADQLRLQHKRILELEAELLALHALKYHSDQTRPIERTFDVMDKIKGELK
jgi:hypothetical protein